MPPSRSIAPEGCEPRVLGLAAVVPEQRGQPGTVPPDASRPLSSFKTGETPLVTIDCTKLPRGQAKVNASSSGIPRGLPRYLKSMPNGPRHRRCNCRLEAPTEGAGEHSQRRGHYPRAQVDRPNFLSQRVSEPPGAHANLDAARNRRSLDPRRPRDNDTAQRTGRECEAVAEGFPDRAWYSSPAKSTSRQTIAHRC
jgi:hypothetical protein